MANFIETNVISDNNNRNLISIAIMMQSPQKLADFFRSIGLPFGSVITARTTILNVIRSAFPDTVLATLEQLIESTSPLSTRPPTVSIHVDNIDLAALIISTIKGSEFKPSNFVNRYTRPYYEMVEKPQIPAIPLSHPDGTPCINKLVRSFSKAANELGAPLLTPYRHIEDVAESIPSTLVLIDDTNQAVYNFHGVHFVNSEVQGVKLKRCAINLKIVDEIPNMHSISRAIYTTSSGIQTSGVFIERGPLSQELIIAHLGDSEALLAYLVENLSKQYVSMISQAANRAEQIKTTSGDGARGPINARKAIAGALAIETGSKLVFEDENALNTSIFKMLTKDKLIDSSELNFILEGDSKILLLGGYAFLSMHKRALTYQMHNTMAEPSTPNVPSEQSIQHARKVFFEHVEIYARKAMTGEFVMHSVHEDVRKSVYEGMYDIVHRLMADNTLSKRNMLMSLIRCLRLT